MYAKKHTIISNNSPLNKVIVFLTLSDLFSWSSFAVINAFVGLFLAEKFGQETVKFIGIGIAINFLTRAIFQIPVGIITDKIKRDRDEIIILFCGCVLMGLPYIVLPAVTTPSFYYILQFIFGLGSSMNINTWRKLFAKNVDKNKEGLQYGVYDSIISLATAVISIGSGFLAGVNPSYFAAVISILGVFITFGGLAALMIFFVNHRKSYNG